MSGSGVVATQKCDLNGRAYRPGDELHIDDAQPALDRKWAMVRPAEPSPEPVEKARKK